MILFASEARIYFDQIAQQFELTCVLSNDRQVLYRNDNVFLAVNFDNGRSFELGIEIGLEVEPRRAFSLAEILRLRNVSDEKVDGLMASDVSKLRSALAFLADLTLGHASDFLSGDTVSFAQITKLRERESKNYAHERDLHFARAKSEVAWAKKLYPDVVSALTPIEQYLSPAEMKRLIYARNHSQS